MSILTRFQKDSSSSFLNTELDDIHSPQICIKEEDNYFVEAIRRNDVDAVKEFIDGKLVDINCIDRTGRTGLQIAVQEKHVSMLAELLSRGAEIGNALLDAVKIGSLECVAILVEYDKERQQSGNTVDKRISSGTGVHPHSNVLTPLVLAAQSGNFDITKFLMTQGYVIEKPHPKFCDCTNCEELGRLGCYLNNLNTYRALVSPVYISLAFLLQDPNIPSKKLDPVYRALVLKRDILNHADIEYEFREDYLKLAEKCEDFAVALLDQCCDLQEISLFMTMPGMKEISGVEVIGGSTQQKKLSVLNFAIKYSNKKVE